LGEIISSDGANTERVSSRTKKGLGTSKDNKKILDRSCFGPYLLPKAVVLRDSIMVSTLLSCSEVWYGVTEDDLGRLEQVDKGFWCSLLEIARTVPYELLCLEVGVVPLRFIIMRRRLVYLHRILKEKESSLLHSFLMTQKKSLKRKDWGKIS
jgi:hypothetical protein